MDWLLSCFRRKQKRNNADDLSTQFNKQNQNSDECIAEPGFISEPVKEVQKLAEEQHADKSQEPLFCNKPETGVEKGSSIGKLGRLKEELDILTRKLLKEADKAKNLTDEVRYLRSCSELLDSPTAFKKALDDLTKASTEGQVEGKPRLILLQSLLTKIESERQIKQISSISNCLNAPNEEVNDTIEPVCDADIQLNQRDLHEKTTVLHDSRSNDIESKVTEDAFDAEQKLSKLNGLSNSIHTSASKSKLVPATSKKRSLSFSGFFLEEDPADNSCTYDEQLIMRHVEGTELSDSKQPCIKLREETVLSRENTKDALDSYFAFTTSTDTLERQSVLSEQAISLDFSRADMFSNADSEMDFQSATSQDYVSSKQTWNEKDKDFDEVCNSRFSEADLMDSNREQEVDNDLLNDRHTIPVHDSDKVKSVILQNFSSEEDRHSVKYENDRCINDCYEVNTTSQLLQIPGIEDRASVKKSHVDKVAFLDQNTLCISEMLNEGEFEQEQNPSITTAILSSTLTGYGDPKKPTLLDGEELSESKEQFVMEATSGATPGSPHVITLGSSSDMLFSPPNSLDSHSMSLLTENSSRQQGLTPSRASFASSLTAETPNSIQSGPSPAKLAEDRPILGTVAAHWSHSSSSSTQPWWDGKGIPNSTNKYKEDQKVNWHATPFEVRLERALATQGRALQKKLFVGAMTSEMDLNVS